MPEQTFPGLLLRGQDEYQMPWRDWWHTEIVLDSAGARQKLIKVDEGSLQAAIDGYHGGNKELGVPVIIALTNQKKLRVWPAPDRDYDVVLPDPLGPHLNSPYAGRFARKVAEKKAQEDDKIG